MSPIEVETSNCFYCREKDSVVVVGQSWACLKCGKIICQVSYETQCTLCDALIPEDEGLCNDPKGERTFCNQDCHNTFYDN